jgi:hypothetical protein
MCKGQTSTSQNTQSTQAINRAGITAILQATHIPSKVLEGFGRSEFGQRDRRKEQQNIFDSKILVGFGGGL